MGGRGERGRTLSGARKSTRKGCVCRRKRDNMKEESICISLSLFAGCAVSPARAVGCGASPAAARRRALLRSAGMLGDCSQVWLIPSRPALGRNKQANPGCQRSPLWFFLGLPRKNAPVRPLRPLLVLSPDASRSQADPAPVICKGSISRCGCFPGAGDGGARRPYRRGVRWNGCTRCRCGSGSRGPGCRSRSP